MGPAPSPQPPSRPNRRREHDSLPHQQLACAAFPLPLLDVQESESGAGSGAAFRAVQEPQLVISKLLTNMYIRRVPTGS